MGGTAERDVSSVAGGGAAGTVEVVDDSAGVSRSAAADSKSSADCMG
jgi:hypothetical protein